MLVNNLYHSDILLFKNLEFLSQSKVIKISFQGL